MGAWLGCGGYRLKGALYHVSCRMPGNGRDEQPRLFVDYADRERSSIDRPSGSISLRSACNCSSVCMTNHFHRFGVQVGELQVRRRNSLLRAVAAFCLCGHAGLTQRAAAAALNMGSGAAVSYPSRDLSKAQQTDKKLARQLAALDQRLAAKVPGKLSEVAVVTVGWRLE